MDKRERHRAAQSRYRCSAKGRETQRTWRETDSGRASMERYEASRIRVSAGGFRWSYRVRPDRKAEIEQKLTKFRAGQREETQTFAQRLASESGGNPEPEELLSTLGFRLRWNEARS